MKPNFNNCSDIKGLKFFTKEICPYNCCFLHTKKDSGRANIHRINKSFPLEPSLMDPKPHVIWWTLGVMLSPSINFHVDWWTEANLGQNLKPCFIWMVPKPNVLWWTHFCVFLPWNLMSFVGPKNLMSFDGPSTSCLLMDHLGPSKDMTAGIRATLTNF